MLFVELNKNFHLQKSIDKWESVQQEVVVKYTIKIKNLAIYVYIYGMN